jgi:multidrug efflux pump subunit AcrB
VAADLAEKIRRVRGAVDVRIQQPDDLQRLQFAVDRTKASGIGLTEQQVASSVLLSLSGSGQVQPSYWLDVNTGVQYLVNMRAPEYRLESLAALQSVPVSAPTPGAGQRSDLVKPRISFAHTASRFTRTTTSSRWSMFTAELPTATWVAC